ncbi:hypothetical protein J2S88_003209 [Agrobacterium tumefaciens]|uniref:Uncharacterized protein n=1 Tax=Agrobacterium tumefaciens TaxID=358 RepID=A0AAW8M230_AGRTU|nr:hypothetical protein [Agrobacterium tumefaciens]MBP2568613.1 hypothetical protein [Agrobacterium tumefaciens]MBP2574037.1 hypothetical protein [Agrobacterium tumefaciens]MDP9791146.1 hypothetical protein [Agrobacterium tumefaciens]MDP9858168.1 hypothetical protein [Agrobacterium tumefaciens]
MPVPQLLGELSLKGQGAEFLPVGFVVDPDEEGEVKKEVGTISNRVTKSCSTSAWRSSSVRTCAVDPSAFLQITHQTKG